MTTYSPYTVDALVEDVSKQIEQVCNDLEFYEDQLGELSKKALGGDEALKGWTIALTLATAVYSVGVMGFYAVVPVMEHATPPRVFSHYWDLWLAGIAVILAIAILFIVQLRLSADGVRRALEYISVSKDAATLRGVLATEWRLLMVKTRSEADLDDVMNFAHKAYAKRGDIISRAHQIGHSLKEPGA